MATTTTDDRSYDLKYRYLCTTENALVFEERKSYQDPPTCCINDSTHSINTDTIVITNTKNRDISELLAYINSRLGSKNQLLSGSAVWSGGMIFQVSPLEYYIKRQFYTSTGGQVALAASDTQFNRIDTLVANTSGQVLAISGTPSASPVAPSLDEDTQVLITQVQVNAGLAFPQVQASNIYLENTGSAGGEWNATENTSGSRISLSSTNGEPPYVAYSGTTFIDTVYLDTGDQIKFTAPTPNSIDSFDFIEFAIRSKGIWSSTRRIRISLFLNTTQVSVNVILREGDLGFSSANISTWQLMSIPKNKFKLTSSTFNILTLTVAGTGNTLSFALDRIRLIGGPIESSLEGETNIGRNVGTQGTGLYSRKTGANLDFKNINAASNKITVVDNPSTQSVDLDINPGNINHNQLANVGTNTHSQIDNHISNTSNPHNVTIAQVTPLTTKGDLMVCNTSGNTTRLASGADGLVLVSDSTQAKGLSWSNVSLFGANFQYWEELTMFTTTSNFFVTIGNFPKTTTLVPAGTYRLGWSYGWSHASTLDDFKCNLVVDGTIVMRHQQNPADASAQEGEKPTTGSGTDQLHRASGFLYQTFATASTHTINVRIATNNTDTTVKVSSIFDVRLELWRVA